VPLDGVGRGQARDDREREGPAERIADDGGRDHHRRDRGRQRGQGGRDRDHGPDGARYERAQPVRPGRGHALAASPGQREPAGDHGGDQRGGPAAITSRLRVAERRDLNKQGQDERGGAQRPDVGAAHDAERGRGGFAAAQAVSQVG
jgi:hypothetical protein